MIRVRKAADRGHADHGWLDTYHTFSFGDYHDPEHMGFRSLRVMNDDRVHPGRASGCIGIATWRSSRTSSTAPSSIRTASATARVLRPGEFQRMTAGTGITHSEFNPSKTEMVHLYQIWLLPSRRGLTPSYDQTVVPEEAKRGRFHLVASPDGARGSLTIQQDARLYLATLLPGETISHPLERGRGAWLQILRGSLSLSDHELVAGDGVALTDESLVTVRANDRSEVLLFDLA